jgi:hypothetical protein
MMLIIKRICSYGLDLMIVLEHDSILHLMVILSRIPSRKGQQTTL